MTLQELSLPSTLAQKIFWTLSSNFGKSELFKCKREVKLHLFIISTTKYYVSTVLSTLQLIYTFCFSNSCDLFPSVSYTSDYNSGTKNYNHYRNPNILFPVPRGLSNLYHNYNRLSNLFSQIFTTIQQSPKIYLNYFS